MRSVVGRHEIAAHLTDAQVLGLIFDNDLFEKVILLRNVLFTATTLNTVLRLLSTQRVRLVLAVGSVAWVQVVQVDFVTVLVFKLMQASVRPLLEQELT